MLVLVLDTEIMILVLVLGVNNLPKVVTRQRGELITVELQVQRPNH